MRELIAMGVSRLRLHSSVCWLVAGLFLGASVASAQNTGWRRLNEPGPNQSADPSTPVARPDDGSAQQLSAPPTSTPRLTLQPGTFVNVWINQFLSSDHNQAGDLFSGTLADPVVVNGVVVAERGQTVAGQVTEATKGRRLKDVSRLGVQLTALTAVDGQQVPVQTQLVGRKGHNETGRDVATVATTTGIGAVVGAAADAGTGAAIGASFGAIAGLAGVLLSPGAPAVIPPESLLTFRIEAPATISTDEAPQAFRYVDQNDYQQPPTLQYRAQAPPPPPPAYPPPPSYFGPYAYPYPYPSPYYAYPYPYWGPSLGVWIGPGFYGRGFYRGGFYRGYHR